MFYNLCEGIWAGPYPDEPAIRKLLQYGVKTFVNLTRADEKLWFSLRSYRRFLTNGELVFRFPLWSYDLPVMNELLPIVEILENNRPSYLHCRQGLDRTGVVGMLTLMNRGMGLGSALEHLTAARHQQPKPSPRKKYHFRYLANAHRQLFGESVKLDNPMVRNEGEPRSSRVVHTREDLKKANGEDIERLHIQGSLAKKVHRAVKAINALVSAGLQMTSFNPLQLTGILREHRVGPRAIAAVTLLGPKLSYQLAKNYREINCVKPDSLRKECHGESLWELKE